ncbi:PaaX family transcriptional regulator C-terminal domain-containing protein [Streptomyces sp. NPDC048577]|uniref:PaaX family transcriptional regulator C-terminal domain-containing protein n=1 Tax=Streptomyces sp. NPDC048577 TaxID=3157209 RepID=UPI00342CBD97
MTGGDAADPAGGGRPERPEIPTRLLVHALVREDGTVDGTDLYAVAGVLGMTDQQVRLCVRRLVADGRFTQEGRGRKAVLRVVADETGSLAPDADYVRHAYRQDQGLAPWQGTWFLFGFAVPEARRSARDALRDTLLHLGAAPVHGGLYVTAHPVGALVRARARRLGVLPSVTFLTSGDLSVGGVDDPRELAATLWPLDTIAAGHQRLAAFAGDCLARLDDATPLTGTERLTMAVELAAVFTDAMRPDPLLPPELLPPAWPGARARRLAADCWTRLLARSAPGHGPADGHPDRSPGSTLRLFALFSDALPGVGAAV